MISNAGRTRMKVCCISSFEEAQMAVACGADAVGLVSKMPSGPGVISDSLIYEIAQIISPPVATFLLTSEEKADSIADHLVHSGANTVQIVSHVDPSEHERLRKKLPRGLKVVQVVHVEDEYAVELAQDYAPYVDALLLDSGNPSENELGGTGRIHDWTHSKAIVESAAAPVFLAGGLTPENVGEAVKTVGPFAVDVCSGVRTNGKLDPEKLAAFYQALSVA
ncbi:phosphoribosylanthranilate isomerase [Pseudovibrio exalbescens]|uniref:phosphoribosylanthranilate isomerase n=1 Tax=Pseudovibrio exalbescens TaxID=197461 RepID=UPI002366C902|nr:phosphoribosylanthranilate isomerase [Pseudovibrio exalbescens]MDD7910067.1 phosphoribosylanthranilate isomerase [Pseudovibrio exalbescens]